MLDGPPASNEFALKSCCVRSNTLILHGLLLQSKYIRIMFVVDTQPTQ